MEQFLGLAVNLGFEGAHRGLLEHFGRPGARDDAFWRGLVGARNHLNAGAKALQRASTLNAASMRDGCDDPLGKAVRAVLESAYGAKDIGVSSFESTHDWWSFSTVPLKVVEAVVEAQDGAVHEAKEVVRKARAADDEAATGALSDAEKERVIALGRAAVPALVETRAGLVREYDAAMAQCFA